MRLLTVLLEHTMLRINSDTSIYNSCKIIEINFKTPLMPCFSLEKYIFYILLEDIIQIDLLKFRKECKSSINIYICKGNKLKLYLLGYPGNERKM